MHSVIHCIQWLWVQLSPGLNDLSSIHYTNDANRYQQDLQELQTDANLCLFTANLSDTILTFLLPELSSEA